MPSWYHKHVATEQNRASSAGERTAPAPFWSHLLASVQNLGLAAIVAYLAIRKIISAEVAMLFLSGLGLGVAVPAIKPTGPNAGAAGAAGVLSSVIEGVVRSIRPPPKE